ncbi:sentrin-specific protease 1-like [Venturia canescens]|uniref:sentrin-specific protease 1-like n=1 Tax=Venturia canescens TaxID=32260 RepID=UPI001C9C4B7D|nr:sentrin-specific protease 1-like [Venturia canescens]
MDASTQTRCQTEKKHFSQQTGQEGGWDGTQEEETVKEVERISRGKEEEKRAGGKHRGKRNQIKSQNSDTQTERVKDKSVQVFRWRAIKIDVEEKRRSNKERVLELTRQHRRVENIPMETTVSNKISPTQNKPYVSPMLLPGPEPSTSKKTKEETNQEKRVQETEERKRYKEKMNNDGREWTQWKVGEFHWERKTKSPVKEIHATEQELIKDRNTKEGVEGKKERKQMTDKKNRAIQKESLVTLEKNNWINDEVINICLELIMERANRVRGNFKVHCMNTFFFPRLKAGGYDAVKRWKKNTKLLSFDLILIPLHFGNHWCLASIDLTKKNINYFDSLLGENEDCLVTLFDYITRKAEEEECKEWQPQQWNFIYKKRIPRQSNNHDCGVFVCLFAEYEAAGRELDFTQKDIANKRKKIASEIIAGELESR